MKVSIIGAGTIGRATGISLYQYGHQVIFYDINPEVLGMLAKEGYRVAEASEAIRESDIHMVCVPTPLKGDTLNLAFLESSVKQLANVLVKKNGYQVIVIRSTVLPLTTRTKVMTSLEHYCPLEMGEEYGVCHNPEFLRSAHALEDSLAPPVIVIGEADKRTGDILTELYVPFPAPIVRTSLENAEAIKCFSNVYNAMKISFFNQLYLIAQKCGLDHEVISQTMLKSSLGIRISEYYTKGGYPFGGTCLTKDLAASLSFVKAQGLNPRLLETVVEINEEMMRRRGSSERSMS
jgi:UDPglucose 6-dehydrogenase